MTTAANYRVFNINSREVLSLDDIGTLEEAQRIADECEQHESQPEVEIQQLIDGEWIKVAG